MSGMLNRTEIIGVIELSLLFILLMTVFSQALLAFVSGYLMSLSFLSTRHIKKLLVI
jgi:hypothetical protein